MTKAATYVKSKEIQISELQRLFEKHSSYAIRNGDLTQCGKCEDKFNIKHLPSEPWTSTLYCWKCGAITVMISADRMSGNYTNYYDVYVEAQDE